MQILKSVLVVLLLSFCAFQSSANVLPVVSSSSIEIGGIIEWGHHGRTIKIQANVPESINVKLTNSNNEIVYQDILTENPNNHIIDLEHLPLGTYEFEATCSSVSVYGVVIIE
jgi:hypothetical protein